MSASTDEEIVAYGRELAAGFPPPGPETLADLAVLLDTTRPQTCPVIDRGANDRVTSGVNDGAGA